MSYWKLARGGTDIVLIQEPWMYGDQIRVLCNNRGTLGSTGPSVAPTACIFVRNTVHAFSLLVLSSPTGTNLEFCKEDLKVNWGLYQELHTCCGMCTWLLTQCSGPNSSPITKFVQLSWSSHQGGFPGGVKN
jgi:hypothetical protein